MTWTPLCFDADELAAWDGSKPCADCPIAWQRDQLAAGQCNGTPHPPGQRGPGRHNGGRPVTSHTPRAVKRRAQVGAFTISFGWLDSR
jgi:hypothetical protein